MNNLFESVKKLSFKILGTTSTYPRKNDCYEVEVTDEVRKISFVMNYHSKKEYDLVNILKQIDSKLSNDEMLLLTKAIGDLVEYEKEVTSDEAAMDNAGDSL